eukprot:1142864-Pelagomonas_calceolata.AAC.1
MNVVIHLMTLLDIGGCPNLTGIHACQDEMHLEKPYLSMKMVGKLMLMSKSLNIRLQGQLSGNTEAFKQTWPKNAQLIELGLE